MFISDVKGELYLYTATKLKELGYDVIAIDYIQFLKSNKYNYLDNTSVNAIKLNGIDVKNNISDLTVSYTSISGNGGPTIDNFTATAGTYKITYTITFKYEDKMYSKKVIQTVTVNQ